MASDYREGPAGPAGPAGAVLWTRTSGAPDAGPGGGPARVLPDGCIDLIVAPGGGLVVAGPDRTAHLVPAVPGAVWVGLRLPPGTGPAVLGAPAHELLDRRVPLDDVWGGRVAGRLARRVAGATPGEAGAVLARLARERLEAAADGGTAPVRPDPALAVLVTALRRGERVDRACAAIGLSERQVHRRSLVAFGYGPKTLARILRLGRALDLARSGLPAARVAAEAGYADQPHLSREVRALAGVPLGQLLGAKRSTVLPSGSSTAA